jgi:large subunit ribosomal protein L2
MALKSYKPVTPSQRQLVIVDRSGLHKGKPVKGLTEGLSSKGGRNNHGRVTTRFRGGGHKRTYRIIDFKRRKFDVAGTVERLEYDPNRTAFIALVKYADGELSYVLAPQRLAVGDQIIAGEAVDVKPGNAMPLGAMPVGTIVHNVELKPGKGGQMARSAGTSLEVVAKEGDYVTLRMASTEVRLVHGNCLATIGTVGNAEHELMSHGKAGKSRWLGKRPKVRGEVMNPVDHPHGGRTRGGRNVVDPWGNKEGVKTRKRKKSSQRLIVRGRKRGKATQ